MVENNHNDEYYHRLTEYVNTLSPFATEVGIDLVKIAEGYAEAKVITREELYNPIGGIHGGVMYALADTVGGCASYSYGEMITTLDSSFYFLRPALHAEVLTAKAQVIKRGKRALVTDVIVEDQAGTLLAKGTFTYMTLMKE